VISPVRSTTLRAGLAQAGIGVGVLVLLTAALWWFAAGRLDSELSALAREDTRAITTLLHDDGRAAAVHVIESRVGAGLDEDKILLLTNDAFVRLAGNLPAWPIDAAPEPGWSVITIARGGRFSQARVLHTLLPDGGHLLAGQDLQTRNALQAKFEAGLAGAGFMVIVTGVIGAWLVRRRFVARVRQIDATARAIVAGMLHERLPVQDERDELDLLSGTINRMLDQIEQLVGGVRNVSNAIAHDLRTPLAELRARLETLLLECPVPDRVAEEVEGAIDDTDRLIATFNGLLRLAELDSGARRSGFVAVDAGAVVGQAVELYAPVAEAKSIALVSRSSGTLDVEGDPVLLAQAIANLIDNALKYAPPDTEVAVEAVGRPDDGISIAVADHGPGIPEAERPRATERFFRGAGSAGTQGVGLGLSMVAAIARLHGGELRLQDNGPGLRATLVLLPRRRHDDLLTANQAKLPSAVGKDASRYRGPRAGIGSVAASPKPYRWRSAHPTQWPGIQKPRQL
jgi:hypothetical protein